MQYSIGDEPIRGYHLVEALGSGGFGTVWKAIGPGGIEIALKVVSLDRKQGLKEYKSLFHIKSIRHANLVPLMSFWLKDADGFVLDDAAIERNMQSVGVATMVGGESIKPSELLIAMGLGDMTLADRLAICQEREEVGIPFPELMSYLECAARAIDFLNFPRQDALVPRPPLQHCDIKPQNILIVGDTAQVCDFGVIRALGDAKKTAMAFSPVYSPPELMSDAGPSSSTDQYSLAITYYELRTGGLPFKKADTALTIMEAHRTGDLNFSCLTSSEQTVIRRATALNPSQRFATSSQMVDALRNAQTHSTVNLSTASTKSMPIHESAEAIPVRGQTSRTRLTFALLGLTVILLAIGWGVYLRIPPQEIAKPLIVMNPTPKPDEGTLPISDTHSTVRANGNSELSRPPSLDDPNVFSPISVDSTRDSGDLSGVDQVAARTRGRQIFEEHEATLEKASPYSFPGKILFHPNPSFLAGIAVDHLDGVYRDGEEVKLNLTTERNAHLYLIYHQVDGKSFLMASPSDRSSKKVTVGESWNADSFDVEAPFGREFLQLIATVEPLAELDSLPRLPRQPFSVISLDIIEQVADRLRLDPTSWAEHRLPIQTVSNQELPSPVPPRRVGLFIGIDDQSASSSNRKPTFQSLAESMYEKMIDQGQLDRQRTMLVTNEKATLSKLRHWFVEWLPSVSRSNDEVFVYFAGYAFQSEIPTTSKTGQLEHFLVPYDFGSAIESNNHLKSSISSTLFNRWMQELPGRSIVFIAETQKYRQKNEGRISNAALLAESTMRANRFGQFNVTVLACSTPSEIDNRRNQNQPFGMTKSLIAIFDDPEAIRPVSVKVVVDRYRRSLAQAADVTLGVGSEPIFVETGQSLVDLIPK